LPPGIVVWSTVRCRRPAWRAAPQPARHEHRTAQHQTREHERERAREPVLGALREVGGGHGGRGDDRHLGDQLAVRVDLAHAELLAARDRPVDDAGDADVLVGDPRVGAHHAHLGLLRDQGELGPAAMADLGRGVDDRPREGGPEPLVLP
jgi:hypothetical protein